MSEKPTELTGTEKSELRAAVIAAKDSVENGYWALAQMLQKIYSGTLFIEWGYTDWPAYIEGELDLQPRSVQYMIGIADWFGKMDPEIQKWVQTLGWSKAKELVRRVTPENWLEWKKKIAGKSVTQIQAMLKSEADDAKGEKKDGDASAEKGTRVAFTLMGTQNETVQKALAKAKADANTDKDGNALTLICEDFLSSGASVKLADRLSVIEKTFGIKIIAVQGEGENLTYPYGEDTLNELSGAVDDPKADAGAEPATEEPDTTGSDLDYDVLSVADLKKICDERSIPIAKKDARATLIEKIRAVDAAVAEKAKVLAKTDDPDSGDSGGSDADADPVDLPGMDD